MPDTPADPALEPMAQSLLNKPRENVLNLVTYLRLVAILVAGFAIQAQATDRFARSASLPDVQTAINTAAGGDRVLIPAGASTWTSEALITKGISVIGAGDGRDGGSQTQLNNAGTAQKALFRIQLSSDVPVRISGIHFKETAATPFSLKWIPEIRTGTSLLS